jgi:PAS domain S-box-containing protein
MIGRQLVRDATGAPAALADAVIAATRDGVVSQDSDGLITGWNTAAERIFGVARADVLGTSFERFLDERAASRWPDILARVRSGEGIRLASAALRRDDGLAVQASLQLSPIAAADGSSVGSCLVVQDRTEELIAQATLAAGEKQVRRSEQLAGTGSFVIDGGDFSEQWSEGMYQVYGLGPEDFDGTRSSHVELVHADDRDALSALLTATLERGTPGEMDHRLASDDRRWVFLSAGPVTDQFGRVTGVSGVCQDVTTRIEAEAAVRDALVAEQTISEELRRVDALRDDFLATVSHELRTPLTSIGGYAELLGKKHPELGELVGPIRRNSVEMSRMIETLLDFCRLTAGQVVIRSEPVRISDVVESCIPQFVTPEVEFRNLVEPDCEVVADHDALARILGNLLSNAARYAGAGASVVIEAVREAAGTTLLSVVDDGPGIAAEHLPRLFERFYQVPGEASRRGTGIGLAIVAEYVARLNGTVWCESDEGAGAGFFVRLP